VLCELMLTVCKRLATAAANDDNDDDDDDDDAGV